MADRQEPAQVALITGASRGIGAETARLAGERGYAVAVNYLSQEERANEVVAAIRDAGGEAAAFQADVSVEAEVVELFRRVEGELGPLRALVNNAGILTPQRRLDQMSGERLERVLRINTLGPMLCAREAVRRMSTRQGGPGGVIVNLSSVSAELGSPGEFIDYAASKGAIDSFTRGLALEVAGEGVRVVGVRPGLTETEMHASIGVPDRVAQLAPKIPMGRGGTPRDVAEAILWLMSDAAGYITGATLNVSGGR